MVFDLYVAGEFYFGTNAARLENGFRTPEHFDAVHAILRNSSHSWPVFSPSPLLLLIRGWYFLAFTNFLVCRQKIFDGFADQF